MSTEFSFSISSSESDEEDDRGSYYEEDSQSNTCSGSGSDDEDHDRNVPMNSSRDPLENVDENANPMSSGPQWKNEKLYPPHTKKCSNVSPVWDFGGFRKENNILCKKEIVCGKCGKRITYRNTPSNFAQHLQSDHVLEWEQALKKKQDSSKQPKVSEWAVVGGSSSKPYSDKHVKQKQFRNKLSDWIIKNLRPISIVHDKEFKDLISIADPKLKVPSNDSIMRDITKKYAVKKQEFDESVKDVKAMACSTDAGSSLAGTTFINVNVHWVTKEFGVGKKLLDMIEVTSKTAVDYKAAVDDSLERDNVKEKVFETTTDNEATMRKCFNSRIRNGCFSHIQSKASQKALESSVILKKTRRRLRKVAQRYHKTYKFKAMVKKKQLLKNLRPKSIKQEIATRFECTQIMMRSFLNDPNENTEKEINIDKCMQNFNAINEAMEETLSRKDYEKLKLTESDLKVMVNVIPTLDILSDAISVLGGEKYCTGSIVLPFLVQLVDELETDEEGIVYVNKFKKVLQEELKTRCGLNLNFNLLVKSSFFDKRYSKLKFLPRMCELMGVEVTGEEIVEEIRSEMSELDIHVEENVDDIQPRKKKRFFGLMADNTDIEDVGMSGNDISDEITKYRAESTIDIGENPLIWWKKKESKYPRLSVLARKYLSVQASSTASERVFSLMGNILTKKRLRLTSENFRKIIFLYDCE